MIIQRKKKSECFGRNVIAFVKNIILVLKKYWRTSDVKQKIQRKQ